MVRGVPCRCRHNGKLEKVSAAEPEPETAEPEIEAPEPEIEPPEPDDPDIKLRKKG